jgi:hypothetical protein
MDIKQAAEVLRLVVRESPSELIAYVTELMGESEDIGVGFGKIAKDVKNTVPSTMLCERCRIVHADTTLRFDGHVWYVCNDCWDGALEMFNVYIYTSKGDDNG